jgi:hypothetical protein
MRTRGAEIYAAGAFFAFPVHGPFGCDAGADGTLPVIAHLTEYYQTHRAVYLQSRWLGTTGVTSDDLLTSLAVSWLPAYRTVVVHVINRDVRAGVPASLSPVEIMLKLANPPLSAEAISPDFLGRQPVTAREEGGILHVTLPSLDAYSVVLLRYRRSPDLAALTDPSRTYTVLGWKRPVRSEFRVRSDGLVEGGEDLEGYLQGMLHTEMRNPPTFLLDAGKNALIGVHVQAVATAGARLRISVDGKLVRSVDLPDRDGKDDGAALEYDQTYACPIPKGKHRVTVDNVGGDWATVVWYEFKGMKPVGDASKR